MRHSRRIVALLVTLLFAHTMGVGSGFACVMPAMADPSAAAMAGMDMSGMAEQQSGDAPSKERAPCDFPWAPDGCELMAPCGPLAIASLAQVPQPAAVVPALAGQRAVLMPPSMTRAPELPPPRA